MASDWTTPCPQDIKERPVALCLWRGSSRAALSVTQAHYLVDKLLCVCGCISVVVVVSAQCVVFREYLL
jgi:hypothetical protein